MFENELIHSTRELTGALQVSAFFEFKLNKSVSASVQIGQVDRNGQKRPDRELAHELKEKVFQALIEQGLDMPHQKVSVSHTSVHAGIAAVVVGSPFRLGVDLEYRFRPVHPRLLEKLLLPTEKGLNLSPLQFWVIKEAAFKANPFNTGTVISQYEIRNWDAKSRIGEVFWRSDQAHWKGKFQLLELPDWWIAIAVEA